MSQLAQIILIAFLGTFVYFLAIFSAVVAVPVAIAGLLWIIIFYKPKEEEEEEEEEEKDE